MLKLTAVNDDDFPQSVVERSRADIWVAIIIGQSLYICGLRCPNILPHGSLLNLTVFQPNTDQDLSTRLAAKVSNRYDCSNRNATNRLARVIDGAIKPLNTRLGSNRNASKCRVLVRWHNQYPVKAHSTPWNNCRETGYGPGRVIQYGIWSSDYRESSFVCDEPRTTQLPQKNDLQK